MFNYVPVWGKPFDGPGDLIVVETFCMTDGQAKAYFGSGRTQLPDLLVEPIRVIAQNDNPYIGVCELAGEPLCFLLLVWTPAEDGQYRCGETERADNRE